MYMYMYMYMHVLLSCDHALLPTTTCTAVYSDLQLYSTAFTVHVDLIHAAHKGGSIILLDPAWAFVLNHFESNPAPLSKESYCLLGFPLHIPGQ